MRSRLFIGWELNWGGQQFKALKEDLAAIFFGGAFESIFLR
jgi:hypothetical protein